MTVVKINAITVPPDGGDELARRFAARAGAVDNQDGFEAWRTSPAFGHGHRQAAQAPAGDAEQPRPVAVSSELWSFEIAGGTGRH